MRFIKRLGGKSWSEVIEAKWWPNQKKAVEVAGNYLDAQPDQQAMIRMPTGTGKTVVIATLAQLLADYRQVLVVAPWENLVGQLEREISGRLWAKLGESASFEARVTNPVRSKSSAQAVANKSDPVSWDTELARMTVTKEAGHGNEAEETGDSAGAVQSTERGRAARTLERPAEV